jgi:hypothetical protein
MSLTILGLIVAVISILITISIAIRQRRPKIVTYELALNRRIITRTSYQTTGAFVVMYGDRRLDNPYLAVVRVTNAGKVEVRAEDWQEPITLKTNSEIIDSGVVGTSSDGLRADIINREEHSVSCSKVLLNQGEWFDIQMLVDGSDGISDVSARIAGARLEQDRRAKAAQYWLSRQAADVQSPLRADFGAIFQFASLVLILMAVIVSLIIASTNHPQPNITHAPKLIGKPLTRLSQFSGFAESAAAR